MKIIAVQARERERERGLSSRKEGEEVRSPTHTNTDGNSSRDTTSTCVCAAGKYSKTHPTGFENPWSVVAHMFHRNTPGVQKSISRLPPLARPTARALFARGRRGLGPGSSSKFKRARPLSQSQSLAGGHGMIDIWIFWLRHRTRIPGRMYSAPQSGTPARALVLVWLLRGV